MLVAVVISGWASAGVSGDGCPVATAMSQAWTAASRAQAPAPSQGARLPWGSGVATSARSGLMVAHAAAAACMACWMNSSGSSSSFPEGRRGPPRGRGPRLRRPVGRRRRAGAPASRPTGCTVSACPVGSRDVCHGVAKRPLGGMQDFPSNCVGIRITRDDGTIVLRLSACDHTVVVCCGRRSAMRGRTTVRRSPIRSSATGRSRSCWCRR